MSHKKTPTACVVVDASIARAAGPLEAEDIRAVRCRLFLTTFLGVGHRIAFNSTIKAEWDKHMSGFATGWLVSIFNLGNVRPVPTDPLEPFREAIDEHSPNPGAKKAIMKDAHLVEAALASYLSGESRGGT